MLFLFKAICCCNEVPWNYNTITTSLISAIRVTARALLLLHLDRLHHEYSVAHTEGNSADIEAENEWGCWGHRKNKYVIGESMAGMQKSNKQGGSCLLKVS